MPDETATTDRAPAPASTAIRQESGSGIAIIMSLALLAGVIGIMYLFNKNSSAENARNDAIASAASDVGNAASKMGNAAEDAARNVKHH
ncbi:hypothetical protein [Novosphingobium beihaiensis]|uniref:Uncharacterized protein n=1 Tax=Novosphingobium beihaiensis TaxID=2930389 RepID=A0ABT0BJR6_9SPHN|nr:hypothetical protein [Novosphingobium beihaiensis]MCJ2185301.1 hypothetical protein [Novosphingobium beihaiensis]